MGIIGIVSEYNPFHKGHEHHINMSKLALGGDSPVVCVMSGDFVQRGEHAMYSKFARAEAAVRSGADLVIELPLPWALSSAEAFAKGSVGLLNALGVTHLSFGSESGDIEPLDKLARFLLNEEITEEVKLLMDREANLSFPAARQKVLEKHLGELGKQLELPNNILAVEYIKALHELKSDIQPMTVLRFGSGHDQVGNSGPKSASELRRAILDGKDISADIPAKAAEVYNREKLQGREASNKKQIEIAMLSRLRMFDEEYFNSIPDSADGMGTRLYKAVQEECSLDAVCSAAKSKRYTLARIRRMCMCACLGIMDGMNKSEVPYARVLAANEKGCELLKYIKTHQNIPIITKPATARELTDCTKLFAIGASAHDFYTLSYGCLSERKMGQDWRNSPVIVKNA